MPNEITSTTGKTAWPSLTIHSDDLDPRWCMMEGRSPTAPWSVMRWIEAASRPETDDVPDASTLNIPIGWTVSASRTLEGWACLHVRGPEVYTETVLWNTGDLHDCFEQRHITVRPLENGTWTIYNRSGSILSVADLPDVAKRADLRRFSRWPKPSTGGAHPSHLFVLGSNDAEMAAIAQLLRENGQRLIWGTRNGKRLAPGQAAQMDLPEGPVYLGVECAVNGQPAAFDHHGSRPEASWPPERSWEASSLGQVWHWLDGHKGVPMPAPPLALRVIAALDHNMPAAVAGRADVPAEAAQRENRARTHRAFAPDLTPEAFAEVWRTSAETLRNAPPALELCGAGLVADLRDLPIDGPIVGATGEQYPSAFQFGPAVAAEVGLGYVVTIRRGDGKLALRVGGCGEGSGPGPEPIQRWLDGVGRQYGCLPAEAPRPDNLYGSPARGFAGGTLLAQGEG